MSEPDWERRAEEERDEYAFDVWLILSVLGLLLAGLGFLVWRVWR